MKYILSVDQSTQGTKAMLFDEQAVLIARADRPHRQIINDKGWVEHDLQEILLNTMVVCADVIAKAGVAKEDVVAMGISNQRETVAAWDRETGEPLHNAIVWQCSRATELCRELEPHADEVQRKTGLMLSPYFSAPKMAWMLRHVSAVQEAAKKGTLCFGTIDSYLVWKLAEEHAFKTDYSNASRTSLLNLDTLVWDDALCDMYGIPKAALPEICMSDALYGHTLLGGLMERPLPICGVLGDSHAALLGQQCLNPGDVKATYGTGSSVMMQTGSRRVNSTCGLVTGLAWGLKGQVSYVLEGNLNYTGAVITWLKKDVRLIDTDQESEELAYAANPEDTACFVPAFTGLGAPYWDSTATGMLTGITRTTGRSEIVRACLECIGFQIDDLLTRMAADSGLTVSELRVDGGPTANKYLMQFQSDICDAALRVPCIQELSGMGAALVAGFSCGLYQIENAYSAMKHTYYQPAMSDAQREKKRARWQMAVRQTLTH
ncbi:MAG: glycerol kinase GlpK [Clostridia bacterium]|nr:glycerol kinase GlpK [Clostridia bacterium]